MASKKPSASPQVTSHDAPSLASFAHPIDPVSLPPELQAELEEDIRRVKNGLDPAGIPLSPNEIVDPPGRS